MPATPAKPRIGFIGLGIMGAPMCLSLHMDRYPLTVYSRTKTRPSVQGVLAAGARWADSPKDVAEASDVVIAMVTDSAAARQVILGANGVIYGALDGSVLVNMGTTSLQVTQEIVAAFGKLGHEISLLDAPVSGGDEGAVRRTLSIMVGGDEAAFHRCLPILRAMGREVVYMGGHGAGQTTRMCIDAVSVLNNMAMAEALVLATSFGLDCERVLHVVNTSAAGSWQTRVLGRRVLDQDFEPGFSVRLQQEALRLVLAAADEKKLALPGVSLAHQLFNSLERAGHADEGTQALVRIYEYIEQQDGLSRRPAQ
jgi:3-hydroxyisobutyrate dehydrogenase-like beta-hydroxyacid dehydrogenase